MVHVRVDLAHVVEVAVGCGLLREELLVRVQHRVEGELLLEELEARVRERAHVAELGDLLVRGWWVG